MVGTRYTREEKIFLWIAGTVFLLGLVAYCLLGYAFYKHVFDWS